MKLGFELVTTHELLFLQNPTTEDLVQLSGNSKGVSRDSYLQTIEEIEAFLQDINGTHEARSPAAPEPELYVPLTAHDEDSQKESIQNQVMNFLRLTVMISACFNILGTVLIQN